MQALRHAMDLVEDSTSGLADEQAFAVREQRARLFRVAVESAFRTKRADVVLETLERSRAAVLRESVGNRRALYRAALPANLAKALREAELDVVDARRTLRTARRGVSRKAVEEATSELGAAEENLPTIANSAELASKRLAGVTRTEPVTLARLQSALKPMEALVYYTLDGDTGRALVVTAKGASIRPLGAAAPLRATVARAGEALRGAENPVAWDEPRVRLVRPLELSDKVTRVIVCPGAAVAGLPWAVVFGERYGSNVPSGSTLEMLLRQRHEPGRRVLAFGTPACDPDSVVLSADVPRGADLTALVHARSEVLAITGGEGDEHYLGKRATEEAVRAALAGGHRWWSVHFACHGIIDRRFPRRSSLALARAFLAAGAPRVVASLWMVNDRATKELMIRFYEARRNKLSPAEALRAAQAALRGMEGAEHPYFWAAWEIWGLPD